jgi:hypothetical protein
MRLTGRTVQRAARDSLDGMETDASCVVIGSDARLMDVAYRLNPRRAAKLIGARMQKLVGA